MGKRRNPSGETGWRSYGPGKYDSIVDSYVHSLSLDGPDEEAGDVNEFGWHGIMRFKPGELLEEIERVAVKEKDELTDEEVAELEDVIGVIIDETDQGFVTVSYFDDSEKMEKEWSDVLEEELEVDEEGGE